MSSLRTSRTTRGASSDWIAHDGPAAACIRKQNWTEVGLAPLESWPQSWRTAVNLCLGMPAPAVFVDCASKLQVPNDGYVGIGPATADAAGRKFSETWGDAWKALVPGWSAACGGMAQTVEHSVAVERMGMQAQVRLSFAFHPVFGEAGDVAGVLVVVGRGKVTSDSDGEDPAALHALGESERRLRLATVAANLGVFEWDILEEKTIWDNEQMYAILGRDPSEGPMPADVFLERHLHPDSVTGFKAAVLESVSSQRPFDCICRVRREDGEERWIEIAGDFQRASDGSPLKLVGVMADITPRRQAEILIDMQRQVLELIAGHGSLSDVLSAVARMLEKHCGAGALGGVLLLDDEGEYFIECIAPDLPPAYHRLVERTPVRTETATFCTAAAGNRAVGAARLADHARWEPQREVFEAIGLCAAWSEPVRARNGRVLGTLDVYFREARTPSPQELQIVEVLARTAALAVERRSSERQLRRSEERFRHLADSLPQLVWRADANGVVTYYNSRAAEYAGLKEIRPDRWNWSPVVVEEDAEMTAAAWQQAVATGEAYEMEHRIRMADGSVRWHLSRAYPQTDRDGGLSWFGTATDIDEQKRTEESLREHSARIRFLIDATTQAFWEADAEGRVVEPSPSWIAYTGQSVAESMGDGWTEAIHPDDRPLIVARWRSLVQRREPLHLEFRLRRRAGDYRWTNFRAAPMLALDGRVRKWVGMNIDITERKAAEDALARITAESERLRRLYETALANSPNMVAVIDFRYRIMFANDTLLRVWGRAAEETLGKTFAELGYPPEDAIKHQHEVEQVIATRRPVKDLIRFNGAHGPRLYEYVFVPVVGNDDEVEAVVATASDVTEQRNYERRLREREQFTRRVLDNLFVFVGVLELDGSVISTNKAPLEAAGVRSEEIRGRKAWDTHWYAYSEEVQARLKDACARAARGEVVRYDEEVRMAGDERRIIDLQIAPLRDPEGRITHLIPSAADVTERARAEAALARAKQVAEAANASKSEFLANMSHEIRTPMAAILGYADLLDRSLEDPDDRSCVAVIRNNGKFLLEIINDILDLSRIEAGKVEVEPQHFAVDALVLEVRSLMSVPAREKRLPLQVYFDDRIPATIESDPTRLRQILINLVGNAIKFTDHGEVRVEVKWLPDVGMMRFDIVDTGVGLSPEQQARLFQPFHQADTSVTRKYGGSGLGLAISRRLAAMLGGEILVESEAGKGSTFTVLVAAGDLTGVPLVEPRREIVEPEEPVTPLPTLDSRVLVVDDRREVRQLAQHFIEEAGGETLSAGNGIQAIHAWQRAQRRGETIDAVLMDVQMPEMGGYEATRRLRDAGYQGPIIALTAHAMEGDRQKSLNSGCDAYLTKPIDARLLLETLAELAKRPRASAPDTGHAKAEQRSPKQVTGVETTTETEAAGESEVVRRVLLVEDDHNLSTVLRFMLESDGCDVRVAHNGAKAISLALDFRPHVVVTDLGLPDVSGREIRTRLAEEESLRDTVWIALSGRDEPEERQRSLQCGFRHYLLKPPDFNQLRALVSGR